MVAENYCNSATFFCFPDFPLCYCQDKSVFFAVTEWEMWKSCKFFLAAFECKYFTYVKQFTSSLLYCGVQKAKEGTVAEQEGANYPPIHLPTSTVELHEGDAIQMATFISHKHFGALLWCVC